MSIVHNRIKERRISCGKTLLQVADFLKVKEATAQRYESGKIKTIPYETIIALSEFFHCNPCYLMGWSDIPFLEECEKTTITEAHSNVDNYDPRIDILVKNAKQLNSEGLDKLVDLSDDLVSSGKYIKSDSAGLGKEA